MSGGSGALTRGMTGEGMATTTTDAQWADRHRQSFHEHGTFFAIWLLVIFASIEILTKARIVLEPLLWAFFLVMGLIPLTDIVENLLLCLCRPCRCRRRRKSRAFGRADVDGSSSDDDGRGKSPAGGSATTVLVEQGDADRQGCAAPDDGSAGRRSTRGAEPAESDEDSRTDSDPEPSADVIEDLRSCKRGGCLRTLSIIIVILLTVGIGVLFFGMVYKSALHMQQSWPHYQRGAGKISTRLQTMLRHLPDDWVDKVTTKALASMEEALVELINGLLESTSHAFVEVLWIFLYLVFWLCQPVHIGKDVSAVFRRYIFLKGVASGGYAFCIWLLLWCLSVDLSVVFGLVTFVFNFIPEVGPFIAMTLPLPVILFDDRIETPVQTLLMASFGQLVAKFIWGNIVEVKMIEAQEEMRMHPVVILFFVAFFQYIWGPTGMLLSVPIVAAVKATLHKLPPAYRNPILVFLEGDKSAPVRWKAWRKTLKRENSLGSFGIG